MRSSPRILVFLVLPIALGCDPAADTSSADTHVAADAPAPDTGTADVGINTDVGAWTAASPLSRARVGHTATRLADDRVLVVGGSPSVCPGAPDEVFASAELLDGEAVLPAAPLNEPRRFHGAVMLSTGAVLVAGGVPAGAATSAERYDPGSDTWTRVDDLPRPRQRITLAAWGAGGALALGDDDGVLSVDVFHPDGTWSSAPDQPDLYGAAPVSLADGRVLLVGRYQSALLSAADATVTPVAALPELRDPPAACLLPDGGVLLIANAPTGDFTEAGPVIGPRSWRWDAAADRWDPLGAIPLPGVSFEVHTAPDGMIFARSGNGLWHRFDGAAWDVLAAWDNATPGAPVWQQGPVVPRADGSFVMVGGSGNPNCAAVTTVLVWRDR